MLTISLFRQRLASGYYVSRQAAVGGASRSTMSRADKQRAATAIDEYFDRNPHLPRHGSSRDLAGVHPSSKKPPVEQWAKRAADKVIKKYEAAPKPPWLGGTKKQAAPARRGRPPKQKLAAVPPPPSTMDLPARAAPPPASSGPSLESVFRGLGSSPASARALEIVEQRTIVLMTVRALAGARLAFDSLQAAGKGDPRYQPDSMRAAHAVVKLAERLVDLTRGPGPGAARPTIEPVYADGKDAAAE